MSLRRERGYDVSNGQFAALAQFDTPSRARSEGTPSTTEPAFPIKIHEPEIFIVEYTHPTLGVYYMAGFQRSQKSDLTGNKYEAFPMNLDNGAKAVPRSVKPAKIIPSAEEKPNTAIRRFPFCTIRDRTPKSNL